MEVLSRIPVVADIFQCTCCGFCCHGETTVSLNEADQKRMATLMALPQEEVLFGFIEQVNNQIMELVVVDGGATFGRHRV